MQILLNFVKFAIFCKFCKFSLIFINFLFIFVNFGLRVSTTGLGVLLAGSVEAADRLGGRGGLQRTRQVRQRHAPIVQRGRAVGFERQGGGILGAGLQARSKGSGSPLSVFFIFFVAFFQGKNVHFLGKRYPLPHRVAAHAQSATRWAAHKAACGRGMHCTWGAAPPEVNTPVNCVAECLLHPGRQHSSGRQQRSAATHMVVGVVC